MRAVVYSRVSTDAQERDGTSLETQERGGVERAQSRGWSVAERIRDTASGFSLERPGIERLRQLLRQGQADVVVAYAVDRLSRHQTQLAVLFDAVQQAGARLELVTETFEDTAVGRLILGVRAFAAEVEREKILERTTRGKVERARSGRIPQAMGRGTYGYTYSKATGKREVEPFQAEVVRRIFQRYAETRSFNVVARELNEDAVPAMAGGKWYDLTVRRILLNESYTGRFMFGKTRWTSQRNPTTGKKRRQPTSRPEDEWIEIAGASPQIVDEGLFRRVKEIILDPERARRAPTPRFYALRGRTKCGICGSAVIGQTLTVKAHPYRYYRCRHIYDRSTGTDCTGKYIPADGLEGAIWQEVKRVLSQPSRVLEELERRQQGQVDTGEIERLEREIASVLEREKRLVRLFAYGEVDDDVVRGEIDSFRRQRAVLEQRLTELRRAAAPATAGVNPELLSRACGLVAEWLDGADDARRVQVLEALQVAIVATREVAKLRGVLPATPADLSRANDHADARGQMINGAPAGVPFEVLIPLC